MQQIAEAHQTTTNVEGSGAFGAQGPDSDPYSHQARMLFIPMILYHVTKPSGNRVRLQKAAMEAYCYTIGCIIAKRIWRVCLASAQTAQQVQILSEFLFLCTCVFIIMEEYMTIMRGRRLRKKCIYIFEFFLLNISFIILMNDSTTLCLDAIVPDCIYNPITAMGFSAMFTHQLDNTKR